MSPSIASGIVNTARIVGATLGVAILGAVYALSAGQTSTDPVLVVEGFRHAMWGSAASELFGSLNGDSVHSRRRVASPSLALTSLSE